jgi:hypothetical protein
LTRRESMAHGSGEHVNAALGGAAGLLLAASWL